MIWILLTAIAAAAWLGLLLTPWRSWSTEERLDADKTPESEDLSNVTVLIPARNEAQSLPHTLNSLVEQGRGIQIVVIDDASTDGTAEVAAQTPGVTVVPGQELPAGWSGKLWALEQGLGQVNTPLVLLLDADISLRPGMLAKMRSKMQREGLDLVSVMAALRMQTFWERLLMPAYIYFFKLIYPFGLSNRSSSKVAAAAGGCILVRREVLEAIGGFAALKSALIDDCTLAAKAKAAGHGIWMGLTHSVASHREYETLASVWRLVSRSAFTQLRYSLTLLLLVTVLFGLVFAVPIAGLFQGSGIGLLLSVFALAAMFACYAPVLRYYSFSPIWALGLPAVAFLYLAMTWSSAFDHWFGRGAEWKGRRYGKSAGSDHRVSAL